MSETGAPYGRPCEEWADALVEHAMRPESRPPTELAEHLDGCTDCETYLRWLMPATGVLAESVPGKTPPDDLKQKVMTEVRAGAAKSELARAGSRRRVAPPRWALASAAVTAVLAAAVAVSGIDSGSDPRTLGLSMATGGIAGELVIEGDEGILHLQGMKQPPEGRVYQAWLRDGQRLVPSSVFAVNRGGAADAAITEGVDDADELLVTLEPDGGSAEPTGRPRLAVTLN